MLETRLDSLVCRSGLGSTMMQARQLINHGHIMVNGRRVDIASFQVKAGDQISVRDKDKSKVLVTSHIEESRRFTEKEWFKIDKSSLNVTVNRVPSRDEIQSVADEKMIIEFYSK